MIFQISAAPTVLQILKLFWGNCLFKYITLTTKVQEINYHYADIRSNLPPTITDAVVVQNENRDLILQKTIQKLSIIASI